MQISRACFWWYFSIVQHIFPAFPWHSQLVCNWKCHWNAIPKRDYVILDLNFHGKWIRFCKSEKFSGTVLEDKESKEYFNPQLNKPRIIFAVPSDKIQKNCVEKNVRVPCFVKPGVIHSLLDSRWNKTNNQNHLHSLLNFENERESNKWKLNQNNKIFYLRTHIF